MAQQPAVVEIGTLVTEHHEALYRYAYRLSGSVPDAEDLTQQVFLVAQQKLPQLRDGQNARRWLYTILRHCYLKGFRRRVPVPAASLALDIENVAQEVIEREIDEERLQAALDELPENFKVVLMLFYFERRPYREIAKQLDLPIGTVMSRLSRAKGHLRQRLFDETERGSGRPTAGDSAEPQAVASVRPAEIRR